MGGVLVMSGDSGSMQVGAAPTQKTWMSTPAAGLPFSSAAPDRPRRRGQGAVERDVGRPGPERLERDAGHAPVGGGLDEEAVDPAGIGGHLVAAVGGHGGGDGAAGAVLAGVDRLDHQAGRHALGETGAR